MSTFNAAVTSNDWPRFSFQTGPSIAFATPQSQSIEDELLRSLTSTSFGHTVECWVQVRSAKSFSNDEIDPVTPVHGCWILHMPQWAIGLTSDFRVVIYSDGQWYYSQAMIPVRQWWHLAGLVPPSYFSFFISLCT